MKLGLGLGLKLGLGLGLTLSLSLTLCGEMHSWVGSALMRVRSGVRVRERVR